jgi:predicted nucleic acid-binding protein
LLLRAAQAQIIVSRDNDLLDLHAYEHITIITAAEALRRIEALK